VSIFISYARKDGAAVRAIQQDVERAQREVWYDRDLQGGQAWWDTVLDQIRRSELVIFVVSPDSIASKACRAELAYAVAVGRPIVPVQVRDTNILLAPDPIGLTHIIDYRQRNTESGIALTLGVTQAPVAGPLPDPLPPAPPPPVPDLGPLRERLHAPSLAFAEQQELLAQLKVHVENEDERNTVVALLRQLRSRPDVVESVGREADAIVAGLPVGLKDDWAAAQPQERPSGAESLTAESLDLLRSLVTHIRNGHFTPILGTGLTDSLIGPRQLLARQWARTFEFPMARHQQEDLPDVAQFVTVMSDEATLRSSLGQYLRDQLAERYPDVKADQPDASLDELWRLAWERQRAGSARDPHVVMARLPCRLYVNAQVSNLLAEALRQEGKQPVVEVCRWRPDVYEWPASIFAEEPDYVPSVERPLVFHVFGNLDVPDSLVLTEDDYIDFLIGVTDDSSLIPLPVRSALADSALVLLGFGMEQLDVRILLRSLISQEGAHKLQKYTHVAAQIDLADTVMSPARARRYLEKYFTKFRKPSIDIFWGTVDQFSAGLATMWDDS
jgi:hypothetical protein